MKLKSLKIEWFKGIKSFQAEFDGNTIIEAENGIGKTTVYDAVLWLLVGKDSTGKTDSGVGSFGIHPVDKDTGELIRDVVTMVEAEYIDGADTLTLRKELHEKIVKKNLEGYTTKCWINGDSRKPTEYDSFIETLLGGDRFSLLSDLMYFNSEMHWTKRRKILLEIAGKIEPPEGFDDIQKEIDKRKTSEDPLGDYEKSLKDEKKRNDDEKKKKQPAIAELLRGMPEITDTSKAEAGRKTVKAQIDKFTKQRQDILSKETERQANNEKSNALKLKRLERENELKNDTTGFKKLLDEKKELNEKVEAQQKVIDGKQNDLSALKRDCDTKKNELESAMNLLDIARRNVTDAEKTKVDDKCPTCGLEKCPNCGHNLQSKLTKSKKNEIALRVKGLKVVATKRQEDVEAITKGLKKLEDEYKKLDAELSKHKNDIQSFKMTAEARIKEVEEAIEKREIPPFEQDGKWRDLTEEIKRLKKDLGEPASKQLAELDTFLTNAQKELDELNKTLNQKDRMERDKARIEELQLEENTLAQNIVRIDGILERIGLYRQAESKKIESVVNAKFDIVAFKLFEVMLNGEIRPTCVVMMNGVVFNDLSYGQKIIAGIDVINTLSKFYKTTVPIWIDHYESLTLPVSTEAQRIGLKAVDGVKKLTIRAA